MIAAQGERFMDLGRFYVDPKKRGRSAFVVQLWWLIQSILVCPSPQFMYGWRRFWWRLFGAKVGVGVLIRPRVRVTYPWNVAIGENAWIGDDVELYSLDYITIGAHSVVSQKCYLCTGTHDYTKPDFPLLTAPIHIEDEVWVAMGSVVMPGIRVQRGAIVGACSLVLKNVGSCSIVAGSPARKIGERPASVRCSGQEG